MLIYFSVIRNVFQATHQSCSDQFPETVATGSILKVIMTPGISWQISGSYAVPSELIPRYWIIFSSKIKSGNTYQSSYLAEFMQG